MTLHLSSLFGSSREKPSSQCFASFSLRPAPWDGTKILVHPSGAPIEAPPMYTITISSTSPNVVVSRRWGAGPLDIIGDARLPTFSSKIPLTVHRQPMEMRFSEMSGSSTLDSHSMGKLKWKLDSMTMKTLELRDTSGAKLARFRSEKALGGKILEIFVPHDIHFLELVLLSGMTTKTLNKTALETTGEVLSSVLGA